MIMATEREAESACKSLRRIIEAAENSNQAGENAAVSAADGARLRRAVLKYAELSEALAESQAQGIAKIIDSVVSDLRAICGEKHIHLGPGDQCRLCLRDFRNSVHVSEGKS